MIKLNHNSVLPVSEGTCQTVDSQPANGCEAECGGPIGEGTACQRGNFRSNFDFDFGLITQRLDRTEANDSVGWFMLRPIELRQVSSR